jgi:chromosome segregation ATPase
MDERRKTISQIDSKRAEEEHALRLCLVSLGKCLVDEASLAQNDSAVVESGRIRAEIAALEKAVNGIAADMDRLKELELAISGAEAKKTSLEKEQKELCPTLGKLVISSGEYPAFCAPYKAELSELAQKHAETQEKLDGLQGGGNILVRMGHGIKSATLRASLANTENAISRVYEKGGAEFARTMPSMPEKTADENLAAAMEHAAALRGEINETFLALTAQKDEKRRITDSFGPDGGPVKKTESLERETAKKNEELDAVFYRAGKKALELADQGDAIPNGGAEEILGAAKKSVSMIAEFESQLEKLRASIAIDDERAEIEKLQNGIVTLRTKIAAAESEIALNQRQIESAERRVQNLMKL